MSVLGAFSLYAWRARMPPPTAMARPMSIAIPPLERRARGSSVISLSLGRPPSSSPNWKPHAHRVEPRIFDDAHLGQFTRYLSVYWGRDCRAELTNNLNGAR